MEIIRNKMCLCTYIADRAEIHKLTNLVLYKVLIKDSEENPLQGHVC